MAEARLARAGGQVVAQEQKLQGKGGPWVETAGFPPRYKTKKATDTY